MILSIDFTNIVDRNFLFLFDVKNLYTITLLFGCSKYRKVVWYDGIVFVV